MISVGTETSGSADRTSVWKFMRMMATAAPTLADIL